MKWSCVRTTSPAKRSDAVKVMTWLCSSGVPGGTVTSTRTSREESGSTSITGRKSAVALRETAPGVYTAALDAVHDGRWLLAITVRRGGETVFVSQNRIELKG